MCKVAEKSALSNEREVGRIDISWTNVNHQSAILAMTGNENTHHLIHLTLS